METSQMPPTMHADRVAQLHAAHQQWSAHTLQQAPLRAIPSTTSSGIPIVPLAIPLDWSDEQYLSHLGFPGEAPYTRGVQSTMYRGRLWTTRIFSGFGTAHETNQRDKYLLAQGNGSWSAAFDLPALHGYDADHPRPPGKWGSVASR